MAADSRTLSYAEYQTRRYFEPLDGLRALSVFLVLSVHLGDTVLNDTWVWLRGQGGVGVFFILSGYLITTLALREEKERGRLSMKAFYVRRTLRIFPAYYYFIGTSALVIFSGGGAEAKEIFGAALPYYLTYMGEYAPGAHFYQSWSLGIEEKFYLAWPLLCFVLLRGNWKARVALAASLAFLAPALGFIPLWDDWNTYPRILFGCLLALLLADKSFYDAVRPWAAGWRAYIGLAAAVGLHFAAQHTSQMNGVQMETFFLLEPLYTLSIGLVVFGLTAGKLPWGKILSSRPLRYVGSRAYGIYLVHMICIWTAEAFARPNSGTTWGETKVYLLAFALSLLAADVMYRVVERPGMIMGRKISDRILAEESGQTVVVETEIRQPSKVREPQPTRS